MWSTRGTVAISDDDDDDVRGGENSKGGGVHVDDGGTIQNPTYNNEIITTIRNNVDGGVDTYDYDEDWESICYSDLEDEYGEEFDDDDKDNSNNNDKNEIVSSVPVNHSSTINKVNDYTSSPPATMKSSTTTTTQTKSSSPSSSLWSHWSPWSGGVGASVGGGDHIDRDSTDVSSTSTSTTSLSHSSTNSTIKSATNTTSSGITKVLTMIPTNSTSTTVLDNHENKFSSIPRKKKQQQEKMMEQIIETFDEEGNDNHDNIQQVRLLSWFFPWKRKNDSNLCCMNTPSSCSKDATTTTTATKKPKKRYFFLRLIIGYGCYLLLIKLLKRYGFIPSEYEFTLPPDSVVHRVLPHFTPHYDEYVTSSSTSSSSTTATTSASYSYLATEELRPGHQLAQLGATAYYPIVMVPGFVTSGLEVWSGQPCAKAYFRQRFWTALTSARTFLMDTMCWNEHMKLDPYTGNDPIVSGTDNHMGNNMNSNDSHDPSSRQQTLRLRASEGFAAADYFMANYWVWGKLIENLADVGYTPSIMTMEPYDWRLPFHLLEERDGYFTKLQYKIEALHKSTGRKVVLTTHSMGALVMHYFFTWLSTSVKDGGQGQPHWVDEHLHTYISIAGSHLGVPKAATALLSGEMKDTVFMGTMGTMVEQFFGRRLRRDLWSSWGSLWSMLPKGSDAIWGSGADMCSSTPSDDDDPFCPVTPTSTRKKKKQSKPNSPLIVMTDVIASGNSNYTVGIENASQAGTNLNVTLQDFVSRSSHTTEETLDFLQTYGSGLGPTTIGAKLSLYSHQRRRQRNKKQKKKLEVWMKKKNKRKRIGSTVWHDPTRTPLPYAPHLKIYCMYGTGLPTERAFTYKINWKNNAEGLSHYQHLQGSVSDQQTVADPPVILDPITTSSKKLQYGIRYSDGDGSVPLLSLGYLCSDAWQRSDSGLNPAGTKVYTREYQHLSTSTTITSAGLAFSSFMNQQQNTVDTTATSATPKLDLLVQFRGGNGSSDHVDILGNLQVTKDILRIVTNYQEESPIKTKNPTGGSSHENNQVASHQIVSDIERITQKVNEQGGIYQNRYLHRWQNLLTNLQLVMD